MLNDRMHFSGSCASSAGRLVEERCEIYCERKPQCVQFRSVVGSVFYYVFYFRGCRRRLAYERQQLETPVFFSCQPHVTDK